MKLNLATKLFLSYLAVLLVGILVLLAATQLSLPGAYGSHYGMMNGAGMMGQGPGRGQAGAAGTPFQTFRSSFYEALAWAGLASLVLALVVSLFFSRGLAAPLRALRTASHHLAEGHYHERVPVQGGDELGQLAGSFNTMAEKLEQVETFRRRLIGDVAHELRTPLTAIKGSMEGLVDGVLPATSQTFEQVAAEADRLSRLVDDLQELSRAESGALPLELGPVSVPDLAGTAIRRLQAAYSARGVALETDLPIDLPLVRADAGRLLQVLTNLLNNALQYTPAGGRVRLSAQGRDHEIQVRVADTGIGIPPEHLPFIFDRFYRVDPSRSRQAGGGSGIGLTITRHIIEAHGGHIQVESPGENLGTTFTFTLPLA
jgi:two-component system sensor histidine kinase BaeS